MQRGNLLWESSRMILPEHRKKLLEYRDQAERAAKYRRPIWDEQQLEEFQFMLSWAIGENREVTLSYYTEHGPREVGGKVKKIDPLHHQILIDTGMGSQWVNINEILAING